MDHKAQLKTHNLSVTSLRLAVLEALTHAPHSDANKVFELVSEKVASTSIQAVYNNLNTLAAHHLIREIKPKGAPSLYETRTGDNHHHIVCRQCQVVHDAHCAHDTAPCLECDDPKGFQIDEAEVVFWGLCPDCQTKQQPLTATHKGN